MTILSVDLGTSSIKFLRTSRELDVRSLDRVPMTGLHVDAWLDALRRNIADHDDGAQIDSIAITGQMHGLISLETDGFGEGIPWTDQRGAATARKLNATLGDETIARLGGPLASGFLGASLAWIRDNDPSRWRCLRKVMLPKDALIQALTGHHVTDPTDAAGTGLLDVETGTWSSGVVDHIGIPHAWLPEIVPSGTDLGPTLPGIAVSLGISPETRIVIAGGDAPVGAFGAGLTKQGEALLLLSSGAQIVMPSQTFSPDPDGRWYTWPSVDGKFLRVGTLLNAGNAIAWSNGIVSNDGALAQHPTTLIALPHLIGERTPLADTDLRGALLGLTSETTAEQIHHAMLEGVAYGIRHAIDLMCEHGRRPEIIRIGGGGSKIAGFQQILSDVLDLPTRRLAASELTALGAAALATGALPNPALDPPLRPDPDRSCGYEHRYAIYRDALDATRDISHRLATLGRDNYA